MTFTDVDLSDHPTSSIANTQVAATLANGYALTDAEQTALVNAFYDRCRIVLLDHRQRLYWLALQHRRQRTSTSWAPTMS